MQKLDSSRWDKLPDESPEDLRYLAIETASSFQLHVFEKSRLSQANCFKDRVGMVAFGT